MIGPVLDHGPSLSLSSSCGGPTMKLPLRTHLSAAAFFICDVVGELFACRDKQLGGVVAEP